LAHFIKLRQTIGKQSAGWVGASDWKAVAEGANIFGAIRKQFEIHD
jgi:hypothetical protein